VLYRLVEGYMASSAANATLDRLAQALVLVPEETGSRRRDFLTLAASLLTRDLARLDVGGYRQLDAELARVRDGADTTSLALADRALLRHEAVVSEGPDAPPCRIEHDALRVAVVLDPHPLVAPTPRLLAGRLREHAVELSEGDRGALREAFALRRGGGVEVTAIGCGRIAAAEVMEEALALGADRAFLINTGTYNLLAQDLSGAVAEVLGVCEDLDGAPFDLILGSRDSAALLVPLARRVDVLPIGGVTGLGVMKGSGDPPLEVLVTTKDTPGPVRLAGRHLLLIDAPVSAASWTFDLPGWREARSRAVSVIDFTPDGCPDVMLSSATAVVGGGVPATTRNGPLSVEEAAQLFARTTDLVVGAEGHAAESPQVGVMPVADFFDGLGALAVGLAIEGECVPSLDGAVGAALSVAAARRLPCGVVVFVDTDDRAVLIDAAAHVRSISPDARVSLVPWPEISRLSMVGRGRALESLLEGRDVPAFFVWELREPALLAGEARVLEGRGALLLDGVDGVQVRGDRCVFTGRRFERKLLSSVENDVEGPVQVVLTRDFQPSGGELSGLQRDARIGILDGVVFSSEPEALGALLESAERSLGVSLADADFIIDVGYGVGSRDGIEQVIGPLQAALEGLGVRRVTIGATRKVTQDLGILPDACQIGQTGVTVNPAVMLCIGVSGAPQHLDYIGARAVVFAFNKDPDAPLMTLNRSRLKPVVHPVIGDLFREVPRFVRALVAHVTGATPS
jgi:hypothetical protein